MDTLKQSKLSIITITYRDPAGLRSTVSSLRELVGKSILWEQVVVDSSPDVSAAALPLSSEWDWKHTVTEPLGIYPAMNEGIRQAKGEYLWFLNSGDVLKNSDVLKKILKSMDEDTSIGMVCAGVERTRKGETQFRWEPGTSFEKSLFGRNGICHQGMIYRRSVFEKVGFYSTEFKMGGDYDHHWKCYLAGIRSLFIPDVLAGFDDAGLGSKQPWLEFDELKRIQRAYYSQILWSAKLQNEVLRCVHLVKVLLFKWLQKNFLGNILRPIWLRFKNR